MLSYRKSVDYADLFLALLYQIEKSHGAISAYSSGKLYDVVHGMKLEIMNLEDQTLELEDEDKDIEAEINHLTTLMKEDYTVMEQFLYKVLELNDSAIQEEERKDTEAKHQELIEEIRKV